MEDWLAQDRAADKLRYWEGSRDQAIQEAAAAGLSLVRIQQITGLGVTTIMRILNRPPERSSYAPGSRPGRISQPGAAKRPRSRA
jgi:hypothetical protein